MTELYHDNRDIPQRGWTFVERHDYGEIGAAHRCDACRQQNMRYAYILSHPDYPTVIGAGKRCAQVFTTPYGEEPPKGRVAKPRKSAHRKRRPPKFRITIQADGTVTYHFTQVDESPHAGVYRTAHDPDPEVAREAGVDLSSEYENKMIREELRCGHAVYFTETEDWRSDDH